MRTAAPKPPEQLLIPSMKSASPKREYKPFVPGPNPVCRSSSAPRHAPNDPVRNLRGVAYQSPAQLNPPEVPSSNRNESRLAPRSLSSVPGHVPLLSTNNQASGKLYEFVSRTGAATASSKPLPNHL